MKQDTWILLMFGIGMINGHNELCSELQYKPQALTVNGSTLYVMINSKIYSILFTANTIHPSGRLALFNAKNHGVWTSVPWLKAVASRVGQGGWNSLNQLNLIPSEAHKSGFKKMFLYAVYKTSPDLTDHCMFELLPDGNESKVSNIGEFKTRFAVFGDGTGTGYVVRRDDQNLVVFAPEPVAKTGQSNVSTFPSFPFSGNSNHGSFYFANISSPDHLTFVKVTSTPYQPLVSNPEKALGFLFNGIIHYWNLETKQVILFKDPLSEPTLTVAFKRVPMADYFVCSSMTWPKTESESSESEDNIVATTKSSSPVAWIWITVGIIVGVASILLLGCIYFKLKPPKKHKRSHLKPSKSVSASTSPSKSPSSPIRKSCSSAKSTKSSIAAFKETKNKKFLESQYPGTSDMRSTTTTSAFGPMEIVAQREKNKRLTTLKQTSKRSRRSTDTEVGSSMEYNSGTEVNYNPFHFASGPFADTQPIMAASVANDDGFFVKIGQTNSGVKGPAKFPVPSLGSSTTGPTSTTMASGVAVSNKPLNPTASSTHFAKMIPGKSTLPSAAPVSWTTSCAFPAPSSAANPPRDNRSSIMPKGKKDSDSKIPSTRN